MSANRCSIQVRTEQRFLSLSLIKKVLKRNGKNPSIPLWLWWFQRTFNPLLLSVRIPFIENGGIYAQASLRGGSEYGEEWHIAGTKMQKQNVLMTHLSWRVAY